MGLKPTVAESLTSVSGAVESCEVVEPPHAESKNVAAEASVMIFRVFVIPNTISAYPTSITLDSPINR
jgi:hypothetical protein